jgi:hypothetical protein
MTDLEKKVLLTIMTNLKDLIIKVDSLSDRVYDIACFVKPKGETNETL